MTIAPRRRAIFESAIIASLLLHVVGAYLFSVFIGFAPKPGAEIIAFSRFIPRIEIVTLRHPVIAPKPHPRIVARTIHTRARPALTRMNVLPRARTSTATLHTAALPKISKAIAAVQPPTAATATPTAQPAPTSSIVTHVQPGYLPFGVEQQNPVLDPNVRNALKKLGVHVTLIVTVGDNGRTQNVTFQPPIDASIEAKIRAMLADANWDPSVCGAGLPCRGRATIKI